MPNVTAEIAVLQEQMTTTTKTLERIEGKLDDLDKKFAAKWVQTVVAGLIAAVLLGFIGVIIAFFIPNKSSPAVASPATNSTTSNNSTTKTSGTIPGSSSTANANSNSNKPSDSQTVVDGVVNQVKKVAN